MRVCFNRLRFFAIFIIGLSTVFLGACARPPSLWTQRAPKQKSDLGYIVQLPKGVSSHEAKQKVQTFLAQQGGRARILSLQAKVFEIRGLKAEKIQKAFPGASVEKNQFLISHFEGASTNASPSGLPDCQPINSDLPSAVITGLHVGDQTLLSKPILDLSKMSNLQLTANQSRPNVKFPGTLRFNWAIQGPSDSNLNNQITQGAALNFQPDALGVYLITLRVQDSRNACAFEVRQITVTDKPNYRGRVRARKLTAADIAKFRQLTELHALQAWKMSKGKGVKIAILDTGVDYNHPDLAANIAINPNEIPNNQIDDDHNGFVDDVYGWDFVNGDGRPFDDNGHGTEVAGYAASAVFGIAPKAQILPLKVLGADGGGDVGTLIAAIYYAVNQGATILNDSLGSYANLHLQALTRAIEYAKNNNVLMVAAAGNDTNGGMDTDVTPFYPASIKESNIVSVAALDDSGVLTRYSNFGAKSVSVATIGGTFSNPLYSTTTENPQHHLYAGDLGTSMAAPLVSGVLALGMSAFPHDPLPILVSSLTDSGPIEASLKGIVHSGRAVDALSFLQLLKTQKPVSPPNLIVAEK